MKLQHMGQVCGIVCVVNLFIINPSIASPSTWSELDKIEQRALKEHRNQWSHYSEKKQNGLLHKYKRGIEGMQRFKKWMKSLPRKERKELAHQLKKYGRDSIEFKNYMDSLMKHHR